jgi:amino acid transporter
MMAPALGIYANLGLISADAGNVAPAVFLVALICTLPTAISFALIAREIPSAGSAYAWLSEAVNPLVGTWMGMLLVATYFFCVILQPIVFGLFFNELLVSLFHIQTGYGTWMVGVIVSTLIVALPAYAGVEIAAKGSLALTFFEAAVVFAFGCTLLVIVSSHGHLQMTPFNPLASLRGGNGFFRGLIFGLLCFVGFSVIATAAEETHSPRSIIPRAMVLACIILGLFWAFSSWGFCLIMKPEAWGVYVAKGVNPVAVIAREYWHSASLLVILTAISAVLGVYLASVMGYARVTYAMSRDGTLPPVFAKLHAKYRVPWNAQHLAFVVTLLVAAVWGKWLGAYNSYDWWGSAVVFFSMVSNILVNVGCAVYFYRFRRPEFSTMWHGVVPLLGLVTSFLPLYYSFGPALWKSGWRQGQSIVLFCALVIVLSTVYTIGLSYAKPEVLRHTSFRPKGEDCSSSVQRS